MSQYCREFYFNGLSLLGPLMFPKSHKKVIDCEVFGPWWVKDAVGSGEDPDVADQTGST